MQKHDSKQRYLGEFYTPYNFAQKGVEYILKNIKNIDNNFRIWDMASGIGNLELFFDKKLYKQIYMSSIDNNDIEYIKKNFQDVCAFQYDYLNDDINFSDDIIFSIEDCSINSSNSQISSDCSISSMDCSKHIFNYKKLPKQLIEDLNNKNLKWLIFINPPYATSQAAGTNSKSKKKVSISKIRDIMHNEKLGEASRELYAQFMFRIHKEFINHDNVYLAIFSKTNYIKYNNNEKFRDKICNFQFLNGFIFSSSNFDNTSKTMPFPVSFIIWKISNKNNIKKEKIILDVLDDKCNIVCQKDYSVVEKNDLLNKWIKRERSSQIFVPLSSAIKVKTTGNDIRNKICNGFIGSLMSCGSDLHKQNLTAIFSAPQASAGSLSITKENFEKAMIIHAVRRSIKVDWLNGSDQFTIPKEELSNVFILDCVVWSLFAVSNQTSAMDNVFYNDKYYKIINEFYPFDYKEVCYDSNLFNYNGEIRFACQYLNEKKNYISKESYELIETVKELYKYFYYNTEKIDLEKFKISLWDSGFWQIRKSLKDAKLALDILNNIKIKRDNLKKNILNESYKFIS